MGVPLPELPTLITLPPVAEPLGLNDNLRIEGGPPRANLGPTGIYLAVNFSKWEHRFPVPVLLGNMPLPPPI